VFATTRVAKALLREQIWSVCLFPLHFSFWVAARLCGQLEEDEILPDIDEGELANLQYWLFNPCTITVS